MVVGSRPRDQADCGGLNPVLFSYVLIKFFTESESYENNIATQQMEVAMITEITEILHRSRKAILVDSVGVVSLFVLLFAGLGMSGTL